MLILLKKHIINVENSCLIFLWKRNALFSGFFDEQKSLISQFNVTSLLLIPNFWTVVCVCVHTYVYEIYMIY